VRAGEDREKEGLPRPVPLGRAPSFGFGDRIGLATAGHVEAMKRAGEGILPVFAQQSAREMERTGRAPARVLAEALEGAAAAGWTGPQGADADHMKEPGDLEASARAGFTLFTLDPSDLIDPEAGNYGKEELVERFRADEAILSWAGDYVGRTLSLGKGRTLVLDEVTVLRCALKYGKALEKTWELASFLEALARSLGRDHEVELSLDETPEPTTPAEHYIVVHQLRERGLRLVSLAPRFPGSWEKGVDFLGSLEELERALEEHRAVAGILGPYKLSLHSGSDKISAYPVLARATGGAFHVKTAGTSYLEALRVAARRKPAFFREICSFARERYEEDRATYHLHASLDRVPPPGKVAEEGELERVYLGLWEEVPRGKGFSAEGRQILHCTYGSVLTHPEYGKVLVDLLREEAETYKELLARHFVRHLEALRRG